MLRTKSADDNKIVTTAADKGGKKRTKHDIAWYKTYQDLSDFYDAHGHSNVPYSFANKRLVRWVSNQRQNFKKGMSQERIDLLNSLDFMWEIRSAWESRYEELALFYKTHGHLNLNLGPDSKEENVDLVRFISAQRHQFRLREAGKNSAMTDDRLEALKKIGFNFEASEKALCSAFAWKDRFEDLKDFYALKGSVDVKEDDDPGLYAWVQQQIKLHESDQLEDQQYADLKKLGVKFENQNSLSLKSETSADIKWNEQFSMLKDYAATHGHCKVPQHFKENPKLGLFVKNQRRQYKIMKQGKKTSLTKERLKKLESIGFIWDTREHTPKSSYNPDHLIQIPIREALKRSLDRRKIRMSQVGLEDNAELLLERYKRVSEWGV